MNPYVQGSTAYNSQEWKWPKQISRWMDKEDVYIYIMEYYSVI